MSMCSIRVMKGGAQSYEIALLGSSTAVDQQNWYDDTHSTQIKLNNKTDADILTWIHKQCITRGKSVQGEMKRLIRQVLNSP